MTRIASHNSRERAALMKFESQNENRFERSAKLWDNLWCCEHMGK
jgi:hypothetical protein